MDAKLRVDLIGAPVDAVSFTDAVARIRRAVLGGRRLRAVAINVDQVMKARRDPVFARHLWDADLAFADGVPIVWAAALLGAPIRGRVSGTDLVWCCAEVSAGTGCAVALIGARPGVSDRAARRMRSRYPGARLVPIPTPYPLGPAENAELVARIRGCGARIVLAALGAPRQEAWVHDHLAETGAVVGIGVGSAFDIISGDQPRAPRWMRDHGLEWAHRMLLDPRRLARRYLLDDSPFLWHLARAVVRRKLRNQREAIHE